MIVVPYTVERRPDTGLNNVKLGVWLFLASEAMLFAGLFSAYFTLRAGADAWVPLRDHLGLAVRNTVVLAAGAMAFTAAVVMARRQQTMPVAGGVFGFRFWLLCSTLFSAAFCALKFGEYSGFVGQQLGPSASTQMAVYFLLTGVHVFHVAGGALVNAWLMLTPTRSLIASAPVVVNRLEAAALYWYFVDLVWLVILVLLYVV